MLLANSAIALFGIALIFVVILGDLESRAEPAPGPSRLIRRAR